MLLGGQTGHGGPDGTGVRLSPLPGPLPDLAEVRVRGLMEGQWAGSGATTTVPAAA